MLKIAKKKINPFLDWISQKFKMDAHYLAKGGFWLSLGTVLSLLISFGLIVAFGHFITPEEYGNYGYILSWIGIFSIFSLSGMGIAITKETASGSTTALMDGFKAKLKWGILASLIAIIVGLYFLLVEKNSQIYLPVFLSSLFIPFLNATGIYSSFLSGKKLFKLKVKYSLINQIGYTISVLFVLLTIPSVFWLVFAYFASQTLIHTIFFIKVKNQFPEQKSSIKKQDQKSLVRYGRHLTFISLIETIAGQLDKLIIFSVLNPASLAIYSFALVGPAKIKSLLKIINQLAFPKLAAKGKKEAHKVVTSRLKEFFALSVISIIAYYFLAPYFYKFFFPQYIESISYSQMLALTIISFPASIITTYFQAQEKTKKLYLIKTSISLIRIVFLAVFINILGLMGAVITTISIAIIGLAINLIVFKKKNI